MIANVVTKTKNISMLGEITDVRMVGEDIVRITGRTTGDGETIEVMVSFSREEFDKIHRAIILGD